jgi:polar amino acid transport system permease protein
MDLIVQQFFSLAIMERALPLVLAGLKQTIIVCLIVIPLGLAGGLAFALMSLSRSRALRWPAIAGIDFFRAIPPLVLLIFVYSGLPFAGFRPSPMMAVAIAFFLNTSSYYGEIYRAGIESVGQGPMGRRALDRPAGLPDAGLCRVAAGGAQRAARSRV